MLPCTIHGSSELGLTEHLPALRKVQDFQGQRRWQYSTSSRLALEKNMKAESPLLGALGSFLAFLVSFFATGAALFFSGFGLSALGLAAALVAFFFVSCAQIRVSHTAKDVVRCRQGHFVHACKPGQLVTGWPLAKKAPCQCWCCDTVLQDWIAQIETFQARCHNQLRKISRAFLSVCQAIVYSRPANGL